MSILVVLIVFSFFSIAIVGFSLHYGISPMPTSRKAKRAIFSLIPKTQGNIYELGSGWGHLIFPLAKHYSYSQIRAFEGSPLPWLVSRGVLKVLRFSNLTIERKDFFKISLKGASGVVCYLYPGAMKRLKKKFQEELKPGTFVVTNTFAIPDWTPEKIVEVNDFWHSQVYLYRI